MKKKCALADAQLKSQRKNTTPPTKHELCLFDLLEANYTGISKLTTSSSYGETCLPTTISELGAEGFQIARKRRNHTHRHGGTTFFTWYWLPNLLEAQKAIDWINKLRLRRGAAAIPVTLANDWLANFQPVKSSEVPND